MKTLRKSEKKNEAEQEHRYDDVPREKDRSFERLSPDRPQEDPGERDLIRKPFI